MVPTLELPPATLLTDQDTAEFELPVTLAEKVSLPPARMFAVVGVTVTVTDELGLLGLEGGFVDDVELVEPHAASRNAAPSKRRETWPSWRSILATREPTEETSIVRIVCGLPGPRSYCTEGQKRLGGDPAAPGFAAPQLWMCCPCSRNAGLTRAPGLLPVWPAFRFPWPFLLPRGRAR